MPLPLQPTTLKGKALQLLAAREYSRAELSSKLRQWLQRRNTTEPDVAGLGEAATAAEAAETEQADIAAVLDDLAGKGWLDEARAAQSLLHRRAARLGAARIAHEMRRKGLDAALVTQALDTLADTELNRARAVWQRKFGQPPASPAERARQMRFLASRGFAADIVRQVLDLTD